ncbi:MAG: branched-chain amino acid ABC transporter permease [Thermodesulfobacteriota bacterium]
MAEIGYRKERLDRGIKARSDEVFLISSYREILYTLGPWIIPIFCLLIFPLFKGVIGIYWMNVLIIVVVMALLAISWVFLSSVGLMSLGQSFFFGVGSYIAGYFGSNFNWPLFLTIPVSTLGGAAFCTLILLPVLRLRGIYFALITLALPLLLMRIIEASKILGGTEGLSGLTPFPNMWVEYYLGIIVFLLFVFGFRWLIDTDYGLVLRGIRDNDRAILAAGINLTWFKTQAVFLAALPGTFAGALLTHHYQFVGIPSFSMEFSLLPLASAIVGGAGTFTGATVGAFILVPLSEVLRRFGTLRMVIYAVLLTVSAIGLPEGIFHYLERKYHQFERLVPIEIEKREE